MTVPGGGWPLATFLMAIYYLLIKPMIKGLKDSDYYPKENKKKKDIDPVTGEYTSTYDGMRYDKDGIRVRRNKS